MNTALYRRIFLSRIGKSFSNLSIFAAILCAASLFASILTALYMVMAFLFIFAAVVCTLGIVLAFYPDIFNLANVEGADVVIHFLLENVAPPSALIALCAGAVSLVFLSLGEPKKNIGRIVFSSIITLFGIIAAIALYTAGTAK